MKTRIFLTVIIGALFLNAGCATRAAFTYSPSEKIISEIKAPLPLKVAVLPLEDLRGQDNTDYILLYMLPLAPYGSLYYDRPDGANRFLFHAAYNFRPAEDLAKAVVDEIKQNRFFEEVFYTQREREPDIDLIIRGKIKNTLYRGKLISYGLSVYGPLLWYLGLPAGTTHNDLVLSLEMKRASDNAVVWSHEITGEWGKTVGLYYNWAADFDGYSIILRDGLHKGMEKLSKDLMSKDLEYWKGNRAAQSR